MGQAISNFFSAVTDEKKEEETKKWERPEVKRQFQSTHFSDFTNRRNAETERESLEKQYRLYVDVCREKDEKRNRLYVDVCKGKDYVDVCKGKEEKQEKEKVVGVVRNEERWIKFYRSSHRILLVGDGDFSFSACLAKAFGSSRNMVATSLDSEEFLMRNYKNAMANIELLQKGGGIVIHEVDATRMINYSFFKSTMKFQRIVFNFPLVGFDKSEPRSTQIKKNQMLMRLFFENAKQMLSEGGEIHVSHKSNGFYLEWRLVEVAAVSCLQLIREETFDLYDYPGYSNKYGFGGDKSFDWIPSKTYRFALRPK